MLTLMIRADGTGSFVIANPDFYMDSADLDKLLQSDKNLKKNIFNKVGRNVYIGIIGNKQEDVYTDPDTINATDIEYPEKRGKCYYATI